ncbi:ABC transporter permease [Haliea sp. E1-2-M8]|uniref:ABC transporter permease n=1 Tax=Haliea sp. E1-2-M8 TaxID=3064706 RepID=UPI00271BBF94|nr:ABC transporter permease [Haliea sp. E1-2-M8]MDO8861831.1 ABC transporter permease [Haliea sp. E1-2-M8]
MHWPLGSLLTLAWRNLWRNYRRTLIMLLAIALGVWAMIVMSALMRGMTDQMVRNGLATLPGEAQIHHPEFLLDPSVVNHMPMPAGRLLEQLNSAPITAWAARLRVPAVLASEYASRGVTLLGVDPAQEDALGSLPETLLEGRMLAGADDRGILLGAGLAARLETGLGKRIVLMTQDTANNVADRGVRIVGIYRARLQGDEERFAYVGRGALQELLGLEQRVTEIAVSASDYTAVDAWLPALQAAASPELEVLGWTELHTFLGSMLAVQEGFVLVFMVVVFLVLSFGLINTLVMAVFERTRELGLMQALGMRPALILLQVLLESLLLLALGLLAGNSLALATLLPLRDGVDISAVAEGMEMMEMGTTLYPLLALDDMLMSTAVVLTLGLLASLLPAWRASRLDPVRALARH